MKNCFGLVFIVIFNLISFSQTNIFPDNPDWISQAQGHIATGLGVADINQDGWVDIIVANGNDIQRQNLVVYYNNGDGSFPTTPSWQSNDIDYHGHLAVGDINSDNLPDVAVSVFLGPGGFSDPGKVKVYFNVGGQLESVPSYESSDRMFTFSCALGDADGDGDLDLAVAGGQPYNIGAGPYQTYGRVYYNQNGAIDAMPGWQSQVTMGAMDVDFADFDNNGYLDLAFACHLTPNYIFLADSQGYLSTSPNWSSQDSTQYYANSLTISRVDDNDYVDLIISDNNQLGGPGTGKFKAYYFSDAPSGQNMPSWTSSQSGFGSAVLASDLTINGKPDLLAGKWWGRVELFEDSAFTFTWNPTWNSLTTSVIEAFVLRDVDKDGPYPSQFLDTVATDSIHVIDLRNTQVEEIISLSVNNIPLLPWDDYCHLPGGSWISTKLPLLSGDQVEVIYLASEKQDLMVSNWDSQIGNYLFYNRRISTGIVSQENIPEDIRIRVYPNPFNNRCRFKFQLQEASDVQITIYDILGKVVRRVADGRYFSGMHQFEWDGRNEYNLETGSGMYIYQFMTGAQRASGKLLFLK
jgi:hypothetical protein